MFGKNVVKEFIDRSAENEADRRAFMKSASIGGLGVVGPTRMDYPTNMAAVRAVARYVGQILAES